MMLWLMSGLVHLWIALALMVNIGHGTPGQVPLPGDGQVRIEAIVTDRHGQPIQGLRVSDFEIRDRGTRLPLQAVEFHTSPRSSPAAVSPIVTALDEERAARETGTRVFALFLDEFHISPGASAARTVEVVDSFIDEKVHAHDLAAVIRPLDAW